MAKTTSDLNYVTSRRPRTGNPVVPGSVVYDGLNRIISIGYYVGFNNDSETVTFSYTDSGALVFNGIEYPDSELNMWEGTIVLKDNRNHISPDQHTANELKTIELLGLTTNNMLTMNNNYDIVTDNEGEILFSPEID